MPASITAFQKAIEDIRARRGQVFVAPAGAQATLTTVGIIKDTSFGFEPVVYGPDNSGREFVKMFDITISFALMQTGANELQNLSAMAAPSGNGLYLVITDKPVLDPVSPDTWADAVAAVPVTAKIQILNVSIKPTGSLNYSRDESMITCEATFTIEVEELDKLYTASPILAG
jgi:hypothetical protein